MDSECRQNARLPILLAIAAICILSTSYYYYATSRARFESAAANLHTCRELAAQIAGAATSPQRARLEKSSLDDLGAAVEKAAADAGVPRDRILRIDPQAAKRLGKTDYLEQATEVELLSVSMRQLVAYLFNVASHDNQLRVGTLRLRMPHVATEADGPELWLADIVLTQRIYAPTTAGR